MLAVMIAKWVSDAMFVEGIYDLLIDLQLYPYLDARKEYAHVISAQDLLEKNHATIDAEVTTTVDALYQKLDTLGEMGYGEDGGFPLLSSDGQYLEGYIATSELSHGLEQLQRHFESSPYPMTDEEYREIPCSFRRLQPHQIESSPELLPTRSSSPDDEARRPEQPLNDFSVYVDQAPLTINQNASMELLMELFTKLGARYVCLISSHGRYLGIIHKRTLLAYLKELEEGEQ